MLKLTTRPHYTLLAMLELALREGTGLAQLHEIAEAQRLPMKYLEQLVIPLQRAGLIAAERGPAGGYRLARPAHRITALEVVEATRGEVHLLECLARPESCERSATCVTHRLWLAAEEAMCRVLGHKTLADLREEHQATLAAQGGHYEI